MLPVEVKIPATINIEGVNYFAKKEFHISLLAVENYPETEKIISLTKKFLKSKTISFSKFLDKFRIANRDDRSSIIVRIEVNGLKELLDLLARELGIMIETPPTHITLYTLENGLSIGISNKADLEKLTKPVKLEACRGWILTK
jgi:hypothetical protein